MYLISAQLRSHAGAEPVFHLRSALERCAEIHDQVEHVYVEVGPGHAKVILFIRQPDALGAEAVARDLCRRTLASEPALRGWTVEYCQAGIVAPGERLILGLDEARDASTGLSTGGADGDINLPSQDPERRGY